MLSLFNSACRGPILGGLADHWVIKKRSPGRYAKSGGIFRKFRVTSERDGASVGLIGFLLHFIEQSVPDVSQSFESHVTSFSNLIWTPERDESENQFGEWKIFDNWRWQFQRVKNSNSSDNLHSAPFKLRCLLLLRSASTHTTIFALHDYCDDDLSQRCRRHQKQNTITRKTYGSENDVGARASATLFSVTILEWSIGKMLFSRTYLGFCWGFFISVSG